MSEVVRIFLGRGDGDQVDALANLREAEGWLVASNANDLSVQEKITQVSGKRVEIQGAKAGLCVRIVAQNALDAGAKEVAVDLKNVFWMGDEDADDESVMAVKARALGMIKHWDGYPKHKDKLTVTPEKVWNRFAD
jgi:hypothetical protein